MNKSDLKKVLEAKLHAQRKLLESTTQEAETIRQPHCRDLWEIAEETERAVIVDNTLRETQKTIGKIQKALNKVQTENYGICEQCGNEILPERLSIKPEAEFCQVCQKQSDKTAEHG